MIFSDFKTKVFERALSSGCEAAEIFMRDTEDLTVDVREGVLDSYNSSRAAGATLRVKKDGRDGYYYTEAFDDPDTAVARAVDNALFGSAEEHPFALPAVFPEIPDCDQTAEHMGANDMIALAHDAERLCKEADPRVSFVDGSQVVSEKQTTYISNTLGLEATFDSSVFVSVISPVVKDGEETHDSYAFAVGKDALSPRSLAERAVGLAVAKFGAAPVPSGVYRIVINGRAASSLIGAFSPQFSASAAQKGLSPLAGKEGEIIAAPCVTFTDDPLYPYMPRPFDDEGTPSSRTEVVKDGKLITLLHNLKTAKKAGCASTSNGTRATAQSPVSVSPSNFLMKCGEKSLDTLLSDMGNGLLITSLQGLHAGAESTTGHFSLLASGFEIKDGKPCAPVERITVAGNFNDLLKNITAVGSDLFLSFPSGSVFGAPSIYIESGLTVSGK